MSNRYRTHYISELDPTMSGMQVTVAGWVHEVRDIGKIMFLLLRDHTGIVQIAAKEGLTAEGVMRAMNLPKESVVVVTGIIKANHEARKGFEIVPKKIEDINPITANIPFEVTGKVPADLDVRLNYRYIDIRRLETTAIFNIQSTVLSSFRQILEKNGFYEIRTPSIVKEATEGGSDLFKIDYFGENAYLAQSPQVYKQLAVIGGLDRVFMVMPVFRAEKSNTTYHLNEITQMDMEMGFADQEDAIKMLKLVVNGIIKAVIKNNQEDLKTLKVGLKAGSIKEITYADAISKLKKSGHRIDYGSDLGREEEIILQRLYGDMLVVKGYPTALRAFYSMPNSENQEISNSYDFIYKGLEIASGAERIHNAEMLENALKARGNDLKAFAFYIDAFRQGAPPHAGWSIGLERFTMKITDRNNIRESALFPRDRNRLSP